jgi:hypothetical protein
MPILMWAHGFRRLRHPIADSADVHHWFKPGRGRSSSGMEPPGTGSDEAASDGIVLLHGIGAGPLPYMDLLARVHGLPSGLPLLVVEVRGG